MVHGQGCFLVSLLPVVEEDLVQVSDSQAQGTQTFTCKFLQHKMLWLTNVLAHTTEMWSYYEELYLKDCWLLDFKFNDNCGLRDIIYCLYIPSVRCRNLTNGPYSLTVSSCFSSVCSISNYHFPGLLVLPLSPTLILTLYRLLLKIS